MKKKLIAPLIIITLLILQIIFDEAGLIERLMIIGESTQIIQADIDSESMIADALHQAIALEKLPDIEQYLFTDTIFVYLAKHKNDKETGHNVLSSNVLPIHIDNFAVISIDSTEILKRSLHKTFEYLFVYMELSHRKWKVEIISQPAFPPKSKLMHIDRGRLTVIFKHSGRYWRIFEIIQWYG